MNGMPSPRWPMTTCSFGYRSNTPPRIMRMRWTAVSMCQPHPRPANMRAHGWRKPAERRLGDRLRRHGRVEIDRDIERVGALQDRPEEFVVQVAAAGVAVDERALEALLPDPALQFFGRLVGRRDRQGGKGRRSASDISSSPRRGNRWTSRAIAICSATSACSTPGEFSESTCMSMPAASISAMRLSPISGSSSQILAPQGPELRSRAVNSLPGPARNPGLVKCSSRVMVRIRV